MLFKDVHVRMKKNNRKPKIKKSPQKKVQSAAVDAASTSLKSPGKAAKPNGKPEKAVSKTAKAGKGSESNLFKTVGLFLRQAKVELKKVKWPTRKELIASTVVVIVLTLMVSLYLGLVDLGLIKILKHVIG
jgi:preprotein translocase subunit SecE